MADNDQITRSAPLEAFIGKWHTTGEVLGDETTPATNIDVYDTYEWLPGNYAVIHYATTTADGGETFTIELLGYDASRGAFFVSYVDNEEGAGWEEARIDNKTWIFHGENVMGVKYHRCIAVFSEDGNTIDARHERSDDDQNWQPWMNVTLKKIDQ